MCTEHGGVTYRGGYSTHDTRRGTLLYKRFSVYSSVPMTRQLCHNLASSVNRECNERSRYDGRISFVKRP